MANILITGANKGIGLELTKTYASAGDTVFACCRNPDDASELTTLSQSLPISIHKVLVGEDVSVAALATSLEGVVIDVLINNAGTMGPKVQTAYEVDFDAWADAMNINAMAPVRVMHALLPNLRASKNPKIMNVTSQLGALSLDMTMGFAYSASKAALNKYMKLAAIELGKENINIGLIHPGWVQTSMGGKSADITPLESATGIKAVIDQLDANNRGSFWKWNGDTHEW